MEIADVAGEIRPFVCALSFQSVYWDDEPLPDGDGRPYIPMICSLPDGVVSVLG